MNSLAVNPTRKVEVPETSPRGGSGDVPQDAVGRKNEPCGCADAGRAVELERPAMQLDEPLGEGQAETGALAAPVERAVDLLERLQHFRDIARGNADAGIDDTDGEATGGVDLGIDRDAAAGFGELDAVRHEVEQHLLQPS